MRSPVQKNPNLSMQNNNRETLVCQSSKGQQRSLSFSLDKEDQNLVNANQLL